MISPLIAGLALMCLPVIDHTPRRQCSWCAEMVRVEARFCPHCGYKVDPVMITVPQKVIKPVPAWCRHASSATGIVMMLAAVALLVARVFGVV